MCAARNSGLANVAVLAVLVGMCSPTLGKSAHSLVAATVPVARGVAVSHRATSKTTDDRIAFVRDSEIYVVGGDGRGVRRVARRRPVGDLNDPAWSSDRHWIAFDVFFTEHENLIDVVRPNGQGRRHDPFYLQSSDLIADNPSWSPDDTRIAFEHFEDSDNRPAAIVVGRTINPTYRRPREITDFRHFDVAPTWSPDGRLICFQRGRTHQSILVIPSSGGRARRITSGGEPDWSPDGNLIAVADRGDIFIVRPNGSRRALVIGGRAIDSKPRWSPDGTKLAFVRNRPTDCSSTECAGDLWVADRDGGNRRLLVRNARGIDW